MNQGTNGTRPLPMGLPTCCRFRRRECMAMYPELTESERFPLLTHAGRSFLRSMRQHPQAPIWNWPNGEQLDARGLATVEAYAQRLRSERLFGRHETPEWIAPFVDFCLAEVPFYRQRSRAGTPWNTIPTCSRADLAPRVWSFVPDSQPLDELIVFSSSGTSGFPTQTAHHPASAAAGLPLMEAAMTIAGVKFPRGPEQMALLNVAAYSGAYTTAIVMAYLAESGCIRINLTRDAWRSETDCENYLNAFAAPVVLGDPQSLSTLMTIDLQQTPRVLLSSIFEMSDGVATKLGDHFGCPVLDLYAMTEAGIVAVKTKHGHRLLSPDLFVEILDEHDQPCRPGTVGEITLTGGRNPFLPLLRYRTGDFAALDWIDGSPTLIHLQGRRPVCFPVGDRQVHSMEVTRLLRRFPLIQYQLHQNRSGHFRFRYRGAAETTELEDALRSLLGAHSRVVIEPLPEPTAERRKWVVYTSDHPAADADLGDSSQDHSV